MEIGSAWRRWHRQSFASGEFGELDAVEVGEGQGVGEEGLSLPRLPVPDRLPADPERDGDGILREASVAAGGLEAAAQVGAGAAAGGGDVDGHSRMLNVRTRVRNMGTCVRTHTRLGPARLTGARPRASVGR